MRELFALLPVLIFVVVIASVVRAAAKATSKSKDQAPTPRPPADYDPDLANRTRRIQDEIRRKIAERRGTNMTTEVQPVGPRMQPPVIFAEERFEAPVEISTRAVLERQQQLADQMRALELARATTERRAAQVTSTLKMESESERGLLVGSRASLLADLREPANLRRAIILREVLGTPVGLR